MARTALQLTPEVLRSFRPARRRTEKRPDVDARRTRAWEAARRAAQLLKQEFAVARVLAFGSLTRPARFSRWSDIDLAAYGLPPQEYYRAVAAVSGLSAEFEIDLVDPTACRAALRERIEREGKEL